MSEKHNMRSSRQEDANASPRRASPEVILRSVGAPELSKEDFARLYKGKLVEIIDLVAQNIVGRNQATASRVWIQQVRESLSQARSLPNEDADPLYTRARRSESRSKHAWISLDGTQKARDEHMHVLRDLEREKRQLQDTLEDKRLTTLLLAILERKEKIRIERCAEVARLLEALRTRTTNQNEAVEGSASAVPPLEMPSRRVRAEHTRDTLSAIQAHQLRMSRLSSHAKHSTIPAQTKDAEQRLLHAVARALHRAPEDPEVVLAFEQLLSAGRSQARSRTQYQSPLPAECGLHDDLHDLSLRIEDKEEELQQLADHSAALALATAQSLQEITHFVRDTSPALRDGLQGESSGAQGHVDVLRLSIVNRTRPMTDQLQESLSGGQSLSTTLDNIERTITRVHATESFLADASALKSPEPAKLEEHGALIDTYTQHEGEIAARLQKLLERKAKKAEAGRVLIADIKRLVAEVGTVVGSHI